MTRKVWLENNIKDNETKPLARLSIHYNDRDGHVSKIQRVMDNFNPLMSKSGFCRPKSSRQKFDSETWKSMNL